MTSPSTRMITLILLLQRQPNQKAADLAEELGVSVRTLHRYLELLEEMGIPIYSERGPHGGFSLVRGYKLPPLVFTPEEAFAFYLGTSLVEDMWGMLYAEAALGARVKLDNVLLNEQLAEVAWSQRALISTGMHRMDVAAVSPFLERLKRGAREYRQIKMEYCGNTTAGHTERIVDPYALVHRSGWWYLVGHCNLRGAMRTFRVDRIQVLELLNSHFQPPEDFEIRAYLEGVFDDQPGRKAHLRFMPEAAHFVSANLSI
jgi:predicted DNA-binding transcriptional regulator YafY